MSVRTDVTSGPLNEDVTAPREVFDAAQITGDEWWYSVVLGDLLPEWGEGPSKRDAIADLAHSVHNLHDLLHGWADDRLAEHLRYQRDLLCRLLDSVPGPVTERDGG